jgi:hypothetical protein
MISKINNLPQLWAALACLTLWGAAPLATADEPCENGGGDPLGECRVLIEINATDGDIGFHVLFDGEGWTQAEIFDPADSKIFDETVTDGTDAKLAMQEMTENFFESTEPPCELELADGGLFQTLADFVLLFPEGEYDFSLDSGAQTGTTTLTHVIPAAPADVDFDGKDITWEYGDDLGECTTWPVGFEPADESEIIGYEVVLEPDDDELAPFSFSIRVPPDVNRVRVPKDYLAGLEADVPLKVEVGAIEDRDGFFGNQTFSEEDGFCNNPSQTQCPEEDDD